MLCLSPQRGHINAEWPFSIKKVQFTSGKSAIKFLCVNTVSDRVVRHSLDYLSMPKWFAGDILYYVKFWTKLTNPLQKR